MSTTDIQNDAREHMGKAEMALAHEFSTVRTGRATGAVLDDIKIDYYGTPTPISQIAGIKSPEAHLLVIEPWDKTALKAIDHAIQASDLGITPSNDGMLIRLPFPQLTEERRKDLVKQIHKRMEECRVEIRNLRRDAADQLKRDEHAGTLGEDDLRREMEQLQRITDKHVGDVDHVGAAKEQEIMEV